MAELWERRSDESAQAYAAFFAFRDMGPNRTVRDAYRSKSCNPTLHQASGRWNAWARKFEWEKRALAYDQHLVRVEQAARDKTIADEQKKWLKRRADIRERGWNLGHELLGKVEQMVKLPIIEQVKDEVIEKDGQGRTTVIKRTIVKPFKWDYADVAKVYDTAMEAMRLAAGLSTEHVSADVLTLDESQAGTAQDGDTANRIVELLELARSRRAAAILETGGEIGAAIDPPEGQEAVETITRSADPGLPLARG
ncbi:MAG: hypothetical protein ACREDR_00430 [Blastocatellia bacterium]